MLNSDESQPARVWREGRAAATGVCGKLRLYPEDALGHRVLKPKKTSRKGIPVILEPWIGGWQPAADSMAELCQAAAGRCSALCEAVNKTERHSIIGGAFTAI